MNEGVELTEMVEICNEKEKRKKKKKTRKKNVPAMVELGFC